MANAAGRNAKYKVMLGAGPGVTHARPLVMIDKGAPWDDCPTITNDAEWVIADLHAKGMIGESRRVLYVDSDGNLAALLHTGARFDGFGPARAGEERLLVTPDPLPRPLADDVEQDERAIADAAARGAEGESAEPAEKTRHAWVSGRGPRQLHEFLTDLVTAFSDHEIGEQARALLDESAPLPKDRALRVLYLVPGIGMTPSLLTVDKMDIGALTALVGGTPFDVIRLDDEVDVWMSDEGLNREMPPSAFGYRGPLVFARHEGAETTSIRPDDAVGDGWRRIAKELTQHALRSGFLVRRGGLLVPGNPME